MATLNKIVEQVDAAMKAAMPNATEAQIETIVETMTALVESIVESQVEEAVDGVLESDEFEEAVGEAIDNAGCVSARDLEGEIEGLDLSKHVEAVLEDIDVDDYFDIVPRVKAAAREAIDNLCDEFDLTLANAKADMAEQRVKRIEATLAGSFWSRLRWLLTGKIGGVNRSLCTITF